MIEMNTSLVTPTSSSVWLEGALEPCELIYEASYVLTDGIGGFHTPHLFDGLFKCYRAKGPLWFPKTPILTAAPSPDHGRLGIDYGFLVRRDHVQHPGSDSRKLV